MKCPFCDPSSTLQIWDSKITTHLIVTKDEKGHYHVHGPLHDKYEIATMIAAIYKEVESYIEHNGQVN